MALRAARFLLPTSAALALAGALVLPAGPASAGEVYGSGDYTYQAAPGEQNDLTVTRDGSDVVFTEHGTAPVANVSSDCTQVDAQTTRCPLPPTPQAGTYHFLTIDLDDLDDRVSVGPDLPFAVQVFGGDGNDRVDVTHAPSAYVDGSAGDDVLLGSRGPDYLLGGQGSDTLVGHGGDDDLVPGIGDGADTVSGGRGNDTWTSQGVPLAMHVSLDDVANDGTTGEHDDIRSDVENLVGGSDDDRLVGDGDANEISGGAGDDVIIGGGGSDVLDGGYGDDALRGGAGDDRLLAGIGANMIAGGPGYDSTDYGYFGSQDIHVTEDGKANDGPRGQHDNVMPDVESITTGSGDDRVVGSSVGNSISTGSGNDVIIARGGNDGIDAGDGRDVVRAGAGRDSVDGGGGPDTIDVVDGQRDYVTCGGSTDHVTADPRDEVTLDCEALG